ncbi:MAG: 3'-5' exonuclease [Ferruginibacter sp.]
MFCRRTRRTFASYSIREELEEERRLFYVAITRAKVKLWLTYANARYRFGQLQQNEPSRFIDEMPVDFIDKSFAGGGIRNQGGHSNNWGGSSFDRNGAGGSSYKNSPSFPGREEKTRPAYLVPSRPQAKEHTPTAGFTPSDTSNLQPGQKIEHQKFGFGEVTKMEGAAHNPIAIVQFELNGEKKIMLNYAKLRILE